MTHAHSWSRSWYCACLELRHISPQECPKGWWAFTCAICDQPGYATPKEPA